MKRSGFQQKARQRENPERVYRTPAVVAGAFRVATGAAGGAAAAPKAEYQRSEPYRRLVAGLPCIRCGIHGHSQAAHPPPTGKGIKECDSLVFPLCCTRPGVIGCHADFDAMRMIPRDQMREQAATWARQTQRVVINAGMWPTGLPRPDTSTEE